LKKKYLDVTIRERKGESFTLHGGGGGGEKGRRGMKRIGMKLGCIPVFLLPDGQG